MWSWRKPYASWFRVSLAHSYRSQPWPDAARQAATQALARRGRRLWTGTAVTTGGSQVMEHMLGGMEHPVLEMETAGIAQLAAEKGIPLFSLRAISDGPRAPIPLDLGEVMDEDANLQARKLVKEIFNIHGSFSNPGG